MAVMTESREVSNFNRIELRYTGELHIEQGDAETLTVEADETLLPKLRTAVEAHTLVLHREGDWLEKLVGGLQALTRQRPIYRITVKELHSLKVTGQGRVEIPILTTDRLELATSGISTITIPNLSAQSLMMTSSGRSECRIRGTVVEQTVFISGSGDYEASELQSEKASVRISGHGTVKLAVSQALTVAISGYGGVTYRGNPQVSQSISGSGQVRQETLESR